MLDIEERGPMENDALCPNCGARMDGGTRMRRGKKYVNFDDLIEYLRALRMNRSINDSPYMDNALLNMQQLLELDVYNPCIFDVVDIGGCDDCYWKNRYQKCSCCRRNRKLKDCYKEKEGESAR